MPKQKKKETKFSFGLIIRLFKALFRLTKIVYKDHPWVIFAMVFLSILLAVAPFLSSAASGFLINQLVDVQKTGTFPPIFPYAIFFLIATALVFPLTSAFFGHTDFVSWHILDEKLEFLIMQRQAELDIASHEDPEFSDLSYRTREEMYRARNFIDRQYQIFQNIIGVVTAAVILISFQWWIFFIIFVAALPEFILEAKFGRRSYGLHAAKTEVRRKFFEFRRLFWPVRSIIELKLFRNANYFLEKAHELFTSFKNEVYEKEKARIFGNIISILISYSAIAFAVIWFIFQVAGGNTQVGTLTFILASIYGLRSNLSGFFIMLAHQYEDGLFVEDALIFIDAKPRIIFPTPGILLPKNKTPDIIFENVTFSYPTTTEPVLKNFSMRISAGEKLAIIGMNGAGKTTLVKLLCRFYDPQEGRILVNGIDLREINIDSWYEELGVLFQEYMNYEALSVTESIALGNTTVPPSESKVRLAAKRSEADTFISKWDKKYDQVLGKEFENGVEPSVGQWQKIALARVFYRNPNIHILDEPTSSIDAEAEAKIFEKLEKLPKGKTVILISHRFSTVRNADKIAVIEKGTLSEFGNHEALLAKKGTYARLFQLQAKGYQ